MKKVIGIVLLFSVTLSLFAQDNVTVLEMMTGTQLDFDPNSNLYLVNGSKLSKLDGEGRLLRSFDDSFLGDITSIDVDNPLKIMLFYRESGKIFFLDDRLSPVMEPLDLFSHGYTSVSLAAYSTDNLIWLYDAASHELICIDFYCKEKSRNRLNFSDFEPTQLLARYERSLLMNNPEDGMYLFDAFGTFLKRIPIPVERILTFTKFFVQYLVSDSVGTYDLVRMEDSRTDRPDGADVMIVLGHIMYYLDKEHRLNIYDPKIDTVR